MKKIILFFAFVLLTIACSSGDDEGSTSTDNFDRTALLTNWSDNIIIPSYENYQAKVADLVSNTAAFNSNPTEANLQTLRTSWFDAYKAYEKVSGFYFAEALEIKLNEAANIYPTDAAGIETNIASGTYNLVLFSQFPRQGFPALDYLLNGLAATDTDIASFYSTNTNAVKYRQYLTDVVNRLKTNIDAVVTDWHTGYRETYIASTGRGVSSSVNKTTNLFVKNLEKEIRNGKIGIPAGVYSAGTLYPQKVEGFYKNDISRELLNVSIQAAQDFFNGKHFNDATTGPGLKSYLDNVNAVRNGQNLSNIINAQFESVYATNAMLNASFSQQINTDNSKMLTAYDVLKQNVIYVKLDMMQALNIPIDYVDGDGD